jgi:hypothetical protein
MQTQSEIAEIFIGIVTKHGTDEKYRLVLPILILSPQKSFLLEYETHQIRELVLQARNLDPNRLQIISDFCKRGSLTLRSMLDSQYAHHRFHSLCFVSIYIPGKTCCMKKGEVVI